MKNIWKQFIYFYFYTYIKKSIIIYENKWNYLNLYKNKIFRQNFNFEKLT